MATEPMPASRFGIRQQLSESVYAGSAVLSGEVFPVNRGLSRSVSDPLCMIKSRHLTELERVAIRERPQGQPLMHQTWGKLLFMHWRIEERELQPLIPQGIEIDTFDGTAWIGII